MLIKAAKAKSVCRVHRARVMAALDAIVAIGDACACWTHKHVHTGSRGTSRPSGSRALGLLKYYCRLLGANFSEGHRTCILSVLPGQIEQPVRVLLSEARTSFQLTFLLRHRDTLASIVSNTDTINFTVAVSIIPTYLHFS